MLSANFAECHIQALYAECHYSECLMLSVVAPCNTLDMDKHKQQEKTWAEFSTLEMTFYELSLRDTNTVKLKVKNSAQATFKFFSLRYCTPGQA